MHQVLAAYSLSNIFIYFHFRTGSRTVSRGERTHPKMKQIWVWPFYAFWFLFKINTHLVKYLKCLQLKLTIVLVYVFKFLFVFSFVCYSFFWFLLLCVFPEFNLFSKRNSYLVALPFLHHPQHKVTFQVFQICHQLS